MNKLAFATIVALDVILCSPVFAQLARDAAIAKAEAILRNFQDGNTADIAKEFDARMTQELPEARLKSVWQALVAKFGAFKSIDERREGQMEGRQAVELFLSFEKEKIIQRAVFDSEGKVRVWFSGQLPWRSCHRTKGRLGRAPRGISLSPTVRAA
jgi:hypothetical protein